MPDIPSVRGMLKRVKHIVEVTYRQIDVRYFAQRMRAEYREDITGANSRVVRGKALWDQFEAAVDACLADPSDMDDRRLTEVANEIAVAVALLEDKSLKGRKIEYEPDILPDGRRIDLVVDRGKDNLYMEVKTVRPKAVELVRGVAKISSLEATASREGGLPCNARGHGWHDPRQRIRLAGPLSRIFEGI